MRTAMSLEIIDEAFIQAPRQRPKMSITEVESIPLIERSGGIDDKDLVREIGSACKQWEFFHVINHGVPMEKRRRIEAAAREFSSLLSEEKGKVRRDEVKVLGNYDTKHTKNMRDWKEVFDFNLEDPTLVPGNDGEGVAKWTNLWPQNPL